ncbi:MAG: DivIVA domain-containing protein [Gordonia sp. (in: high G+C Gram-positive bacteria)]
MQTLLLYLLIMAVVVVAVFALVWFVFGRGEDLPALDEATTLTRLPASGISGDDVRELLFAQTMRGYRQSEVDWVLARLAGEIDDLRALVHHLQDRAGITADAGIPGDAGITANVAVIPNFGAGASQNSGPDQPADD